MGELASMRQGLTVFVFELQQVVAALFDDGAGNVLVAVQRIGGDERILQIGALVKPPGDGEFPFLFIVLGAGFLFGDANRLQGRRFDARSDKP